MNFSRFFFAVLFSFSLLTSLACNTSRNIDEEDRRRRTYGYSEDEWQDLKETTKYLQDITIQNVFVAGSWTQLDYNLVFISDDQRTYTYLYDQRFYIDLSSKEVFVRPRQGAMTKIASLTCKEQILDCQVFIFNVELKDLLPDTELPSKASAVPMTFTYKQEQLNLELLDRDTSKVISRLQGAKITIDLFPDIYRKLYAELPTEVTQNAPTDQALTFSVHYIADTSSYFYDMPVTPPTEGLLFDRCEQESVPAGTTVDCHFINPQDKSIVTTKYALKKAETETFHALTR